MSKSEYYYEQGANHCYTCGHSRHSHNTSPEDSTCYVCDSCKDVNLLLAVHWAVICHVSGNV
jgi:hypothetical protein